MAQVQPQNPKHAFIASNLPRAPSILDLTHRSSLDLELMSFPGTADAGCNGLLFRPITSKLSEFSDPLPPECNLISLLKLNIYFPVQVSIRQGSASPSLSQKVYIRYLTVIDSDDDHPSRCMRAFWDLHGDTRPRYSSIPSLTTHICSLFYGVGVYLIMFPRCINVLRQKEIKAGLLGYLLATAIVSLLLVIGVSLFGTLKELILMVSSTGL